MYGKSKRFKKTNMDRAKRTSENIMYMRLAKEARGLQAILRLLVSILSIEKAS